MCKSKFEGGKRCSNHEFLKLARLQADPNSTEEQIRAQQARCNITPRGIKILREQGQDRLADECQRLANENNKLCKARAAFYSEHTSGYDANGYDADGIDKSHNTEEDNFRRVHNNGNYTQEEINAQADKSSAALRRKIAADPETSSETLDHLMEAGGSVREAVLANSSTGFRSLERVAEYVGNGQVHGNKYYASEVKAAQFAIKVAEKKEKVRREEEDKEWARVSSPEYLARRAEFKSVPLDLSDCQSASHENVKEVGRRVTAALASVNATAGELAEFKSHAKGGSSKPSADDADQYEHILDTCRDWFDAR